MADNWQLKAVLSAKSEGMVKALDNVAKMAKTSRKYLLDIGSSAAALGGRLALPLGLMTGAAAAFSVAGLKSAISSFTALGDEVHKSAQRIGVSTDEYQRIKYIAGQSGVSAEALGSSMGRLNRSIGDAAAGKNKDLSALLAKAGISMRGANGELRSAADLLPEVAGLFARNGNAATQARMGNALFGKSWQTLAPLLVGGQSGIEKLNARYKELGIGVDETAIVAGEAFGDQLDDLHQAVSSYGNSIASKLLPVLSPLVEGTIEWVAANREMITANISSVLADIAANLKTVDWSGVIRGVGDFVSGIRTFVGWIGGARNALIALVVIMNAQTILAVGGLIGAVARAGLAFGGMAVQAYLAGNTGTLALMRTAAVALATAGPMGMVSAAFSWMSAAAAGAGGIISGAMALVTGAIRGVGVALMANPLGIILGLATAALLIYQNWDTLKTWFGSFFNWLGAKFQSLIGWASHLIDAVKGIFGGGGGSQVSQQTVGGAQTMPAMAGPRPDIVGAAGRVQASGEIKISFDNAPAGMRVDQGRPSGDVPINTAVGYRSAALGMP